MTWELNIKNAQNGYIIEWEEEEAGKQQEVIEEDDELTENRELDTMKRLLSLIKEYFGVYYSKHNKHNLVIKIENEKEAD